MQKENELFPQDEYVITPTHLISSDADQPYLNAEQIDREMQSKLQTERLKITRLSQEGLEHFVKNYGKNYRVLDFYVCTQICDFSPLGDLDRVEAIRIEWCRKADRLWDMSGNSSLKVLSVSNAKKITQNPYLLQTCRTLEEVRFWGPLSGGTYPMESLECFRGMDSLRRLALNWIQLKNQSMDVLDTLSNLQEFHFDPGMLTTQMIARLVARYPHLHGDSLRAYDDAYIKEGEVRVCGFRKPTLYLPEQQKQLERYVKEFDDLVEAYRCKL